MNEKHPEVVVVGAGGLGGVFGALLAENGLPVTLLDTNKAHVEAIRSSGGIRIIGPEGERHVALAATRDASTIRSADLLIFLCKAGANREAARNVKALIGPSTVAVTFQNGLGNEETLAEILGASTVMAGVTAQGGAREAPGVVRNLVQLPTHVGEVGGGMTDRAQWLGTLLTDHGIPTAPSENLMREKWMKLFANIAISATTGLTGLTIGGVGDLAPLHSAALHAIDEAAAVSAAEGHVFTMEERRLNYEKLLHSPDGAAATTSMYRDLQAHRESEVEFIYGTVIERASRHKLPVPILRTLHALVRGVETSWVRPQYSEAQ